MAFISSHWVMIMAALFAVSEVLAEVPGIQANSVFQLFFNALKGAVSASKDGGSQGGA